MIEIQHIFHQLPNYIFWKDTNFNYLGANENFLKSAGLKCVDEIVGRNDFHLPWKIFAKKYRSDDQYILRSKEALHCKEHHKDITGQITLAIVNKKPLYDEKGLIVGIIGFYSKISLVTVTQIKRPYLPKRQREVLVLITNGLSAKQIAHHLSISQRTVEYYSEIIKSKLGCLNKAELIKKAFSLGYIDYEYYNISP